MKLRLDVIVALVVLFAGLLWGVVHDVPLRGVVRDIPSLRADLSSGVRGVFCDSTVDIDGSGDITLIDLVVIAREFGRSDVPYGAREDVNRDGIVNIVDLVTVARVFGRECVSPYVRNDAAGALRTLVLLVKQAGENGASLPSREEVRGHVFEGEIAGLIQEQSYGKAWLEGEVKGWYEISGDIWRVLFEEVEGNTFSIEYDNNIAQEMGKLLDVVSLQDSGIRFDAYSQIVIVPSVATGGYSWFGPWRFPTNTFGNIFAGISVVNVRSSWDNFRNAFFHEYMHSLGLLHANAWECGARVMAEDCEHVEYGNHFDPMGIGHKPPLHLSAYFKEFLGWLSVRDGSMKDITEEGVYTLRALEGSDAMVARVRIPGSAGRVYYLEYRLPLGLDRILADETTPLSSGGTRRNVRRQSIGGVLVNWFEPDSVYGHLGLGQMRMLDMIPSDEYQQFCEQGNPFYVYCEDWDNTALHVGSVFEDDGVRITVLSEQREQGQIDILVQFFGAE